MKNKNYLIIALLLTAFFMCSSISAQVTKDIEGLFIVGWKTRTLNRAIILIDPVDENGTASVTVRVSSVDDNFNIVKAEYFSKLKYSENNGIIKLLITEGKFSKFIKGEDLSFFSVSFLIQIKDEEVVGECDFGKLEFYSFENKNEIQTAVDDFYKTDDPLYKAISSYIDKME